MIDLNDNQKAFLDELEEPASTRAWFISKLKEGRDRVVIKNGRQMTFKGADTMRAVVAYLESKKER